MTVAGSWSEGEAFGEIRSLVSRRPGADAFARVCELIDEAEEHAPGLYASRWRGFVDEHLPAWRSCQRTVALRRQREALDAAGAPWAEWVGGVELVGFDLSHAHDVGWAAGKLRETFPTLEHLGLSQIPLSTHVVASACEAGVFDGLASVAFEECSMRLEAIEVLLERLEARGEVEHLRFSRCNLRRAPLERVCATSLAPRLRSLDLSRHVTFDVGVAKTLAARAPAFESLERLSLGSCRIEGAGALALAEARWSDALRHLGLTLCFIKEEGIEALARNDLLGALFEEGGERALNLGSQQIGDRGLQVVFDSGVLEGIENLKLGDCGLTTLEPFRESAVVEGLRVLELTGAWGDEEDGAPLLEAISGMSRLEEFLVTRSGLGGDFVERLCASAGAQGLRSLGLGFCRTSCVRDLEVLLGWDRFQELDRFSAMFELPEGSRIIERALETGRFTRGGGRRGNVTLNAASSGGA